MEKRILLLSAIVLLWNAGQAQTFTLKSKDISGAATNKQLGYGCDGENSSPQLYWEHAPLATKSFAITIHEEGGPNSSGWWDWIIFDISSTMTNLKSDAGNPTQNNAPEGTVQSITDFGKPGYWGPCPPQDGKFHRYLITLYALDVEKLPVKKNTASSVVVNLILQHTIQKTTLLMYYKH